MFTRPSALVLSDADNTLWDTDMVFAKAQLALLNAVEEETGHHAPPTANRLAFVRAYDQELAERHHASLRYPPELLIRAIALGLKGVTPAVAAKRVWGGVEASQSLLSHVVVRIRDSFHQALAGTPSARPGVIEGLRQLRDLNCLIIVVTENSKERCRRLIEIHKLVRLIDKVVCAPKHTALFCRLAKLAEKATPKIIIGDQVDRDIMPAQQAGFTTILFPGNFKPKWALRHEVVPDFLISSFDEVIPIVRARIESARRRSGSELAVEYKR